MTKLIRSIGVIRYWPEQKAAEHETIERLKRSIGILGLTVVEVGHDGRTEDGFEPDLVINLHFDAPKLSVQPTLHTLWNPTSFLKNRNLEQSGRNTVSNTFYSSGNSPKNDTELCELLGIDKAKLVNPILPSLDSPILPPINHAVYRLFYAGINWERIRGISRYSNLLKILDDSSFLDIYGPKNLFGVEVWEGFKSYRGEIPFDGETLIQVANQNGAYLCLSSEDHLGSELLSNRLFEACAAGAVIIANRNPAVYEIFGESIAWLESSDEVRMASEIQAIMREINQEPSEAFRKANSAQKIFKDNFLLSEMLKVALEEVEVLYSTYLETYAKFVDSIDSQTYPRRPWVHISSGKSQPIAYAIGKSLHAISDSTEINLLLGNWLSISKDGATILNSYKVNFCPFCHIDIGASNFLIKDEYRYVVYSKSLSDLRVHSSAEPLFVHFCENSSSDWRAIDSLMVRFKQQLAPQIVSGWHPKQNRRMKQSRQHIIIGIFKVGRFIFKKTPLKIFHSRALSIWIWFRS